MGSSWKGRTGEFSAAFEPAEKAKRCEPVLTRAEYFYIDAVSSDTAIFVFGDKMEAIECANEYKAYTAVEAIQNVSELSNRYSSLYKHLSLLSTNHLSGDSRMSTVLCIIVKR